MTLFNEVLRALAYSASTIRSVLYVYRNRRKAPGFIYGDIRR